MLTTLKVSACLFAGVALAAALTSVQAAPAETFTYDDIIYQSDGKGMATVWGYSSSNPPVDLVIPSTVKHKYSVEVKDAETGKSRWEEHQETCSVTGIRDDAFLKCPSLVSVFLPEGITCVRGFSACPKLKRVTVPEKCLEIGVAAFNECSQLSQVKLPSTLLRIGDSAFAECRNLQDMELPDSLLEVGPWAFYLCRSWENAAVPPRMSQKSIGDNTYYGCDFLKEIVIPDGTEEIKYGAFEGCDGASRIVIPSSVRKIHSYAFIGCTGVRTVIINSTEIEILGGYSYDRPFGGCPIEDLQVPYLKRSLKTDFPVSDLQRLTTVGEWTEIPDEFCSGCENMYSFEIPAEVTRIGKSAFSGCKNWNCFSLPEKITEIADGAFQNCERLSVDIPSGVTRLGDSAFRGCKKLVRVTVPSGVEELGKYLFEDCTGLKDVTLPEGLAKIGHYAFADCKSLSSVVIPATVTYMGDSAFGRCSALKECHFQGLPPDRDPYRRGGYCDVFSEVAEGAFGTYPRAYAQEWEAALDKNKKWGGLPMQCVDGQIVQPKKSYFTVKFSAGGLGVEGTMADQTFVSGESQKLRKNAFKRAGYAFDKWFAQQTYPSREDQTGVISTSLEDEADMSKFAVADGVVYTLTPMWKLEVDKDLLFAFDVATHTASVVGYKGKARNLIIPGTVMARPDGIRSDYESENVQSYSVTAIAESAFENNMTLYDVELPASLVSIGNRAFQACSELSNVSLDNVKKIGEQAFRDCPKFRSILDGDECLEEVGAQAFYRCGMTSVSLPKTVRKLGGGVFQLCAKLKEAAIDGSELELPNGCFYDCSALQKVTLGNGVRWLPKSADERSGAFAGCSALQEVTLGNMLKDIPDYAFYGLAALKSVTSKKECLDEIGRSAFVGCQALEKADLIPKYIGPSAFQGIKTHFGLDFRACSFIDEQAFAGSGLGGSYERDGNSTGWLGGVLNLPKIESICSEAFLGCKNLRDVKFGPELKDLCGAAFAKTGIERVEFMGERPPKTYRSSVLVFDGVSGNARGYFPDADGKGGYWRETLDPQGTWQGLVFYRRGGEFALKLTLMAEKLNGSAAFDPSKVYVYISRWSDKNKTAFADIRREDAKPLFDSGSLVNGEPSVGSYTLWFNRPGFYDISCGYKNGEWRAESGSQGIEVTEDDVANRRDRQIVVRYVPVVHGKRVIDIPGSEIIKPIARDSDSDGHPDLVEVKSQFTSSVSGTFWWTAALEDEEGNFIAPATGTTTLNVGDNEVAFAFDGETVRAHGACGGYRVNCIVFSDGTEEIAVNEELSVSALSFDDWGDEPTPAALVRQVVLDGNGGTCPVPTVDLALGQPYGELPTATCAGYAFDGWYTAATGGEKIAAEDLFQSRVDRLYAHWRRGAEDGVYQKEVGGVTWTYVVKNCQATVGGPDDAQRLAVDSGASGSLVIPAAFDNCPVTAIAPAAFKDCAQLAAVTVPASVRVIPEQAFMGCTALESVVLAEGLVEIRASAFENCRALKALTIPATVVRIGGRAFYGCRGLPRMIFPSSVREIGSEAFVGLRRLMEYEFEGLPPEVEEDTFGNGGLFSWSKKHEDVWQSLSAQGVWENLEVHGLDSPSKTKSQTVKGLKWRYTVKNGEASVGGCDDDGSPLGAIPQETSGKVVIPSTLGGYPVTAIGNEAFYACDRLTEIVVPKGVKTIGYGAFAYCEQVKKVVLPTGLRSIGEFALAGCFELQSVELPANLVSIGPEAFRWSALREVILPAKVAYVSPSAFVGCSDLLRFKVATGNKSYKVVNGLLVTANGEGLVGIPHGLRVLNVPEGVKEIEKDIGRVNGALAEIHLPASVSRFDPSVFSSCSALQAYVADGENKTYKSVDGFLLTKDGTRLVAGPIGRREVVLPAGIRVLSKDALNGMRAVSVRLNDGLVTIEENGMRNSSQLRSLTIPDSVEFIGANALDSASIEEITFEGEPPPECDMKNWNGCQGKYLSAHAAAWRKVLGGKTGNWNGLPMSQVVSPVGVRTYAVTFDCGVHGQWVEPGAKSQLVSAGSAATAPAVEAKPGWRFVGWDTAFDAVQSDLLVTAQYEPLVYAISYVGTKGAVNRNPTTYTPDAGVTFAPLSETAGYAFAGWSPKAIAKGAFGDVTVTAQWKKITKAKVSVGSFGAVSGTKVSVSAKSAKPKASVTFKATPAKAKGKREASFFAGWYADADGIELVSMKNPLKYKVPAVSSVKLYARFEKVKDYLPTIHCGATYALTPGVPFSASVGATSPFAGAIAVSVKGLPSGLKYKGGTISGTPKAFSKSVTATVTAKNAAGTVKKKIVFTSVNPGFVVWAIAQAAGSESVYVGPKAQLTPYVGVPFEMALSSAPGLSGRDDYEASAVTVTGLKNGLSFNAKKGQISGVATKTGKQTVKATFKNKWGWTESFSFTISPRSLPKWIVGSYVGLGSYGSADGAVTLTVGAGGKVSGKITAGGKNYSFSAKSFAGSTGLGDETVFMVKAKVNKKYETTFTFATADGVIGCVTASSANGEVALEAWQDAWARKDVYLPPYANGTVKFTFADLEALGVAVKAGDSLSIKFSSKGAVKVAGKLGGKTISASTKVVVTEVFEDGKAAAGEVIVPYGARAAVLPFVWNADAKPAKALPDAESEV